MIGNRFKFIMVLAALGVSACNMASLTPRGGETAKPGSSEHLLQGEGKWAMVEENKGTDPAKLHTDAKTKVDPTNLAKKQHLPDHDLKIARNDKAAYGQDMNYRLIRVERDVQGLRDDFKKLLPPLSNLIVADKNLDKTIDDIEAKNAIEPAAGPESDMRAEVPKATGAPMTMAAAMAAPAPNPKPLATPVAASSSGGSMVSNLRLGEHPGKTRLVLDLSGPSPYKAELDNTEKLLLVQIPEAGWSAQQQQNLSNHPLIAGYTVQSSVDGGATLAIELKKPVKITSEAALSPNATYHNHRIFVDLVAL